jgi:hypothetical protein
MANITIDLGITGLTNVKALPFSADFAQVWDGNLLAPVDAAVPAFVDMPEVLVNDVGSGIYKSPLPTPLDIISDNDGLWISIYDAGLSPSVSDPLYGYIPPSCQSTLIKAVVDAIGQLEITIDPNDLQRALKGTVVKPTRVVFGPCQRPPCPSHTLGLRVS